MQSDAKVEKKCATSYLIDDMILKSILTFLPIISDSYEVNERPVDWRFAGQKPMDK